MLSKPLWTVTTAAALAIGASLSLSSCQDASGWAPQHPADTGPGSSSSTSPARPQVASTNPGVGIAIAPNDLHSQSGPAN